MLRQSHVHAALRLSPILAACAMVVLCVLAQPKHKEIELKQQHAANNARSNFATFQALQNNEAPDDFVGGDADEAEPTPQDVMAIQGAQAGTILGLDYMEATAAGAAATAAAVGPELIPLIALRQRYGAPAAQLRTVEAPYRLAGFQVNQANQDAPSANPWSGMSESQYLTAEQSGADVPAQASAKHPAGPKKQALRILNPGELSGDLKDPDDPWGYSHPRCRGLPTCSDSTSSPAVKDRQNRLKQQALRILNPGELSGDLKDPDDPWGYSHPRCRGLPTCSDSTSSPAVKRHQAGVRKAARSVKVSDRAPTPETPNPKPLRSRMPLAP